MRVQGAQPILNVFRCRREKNYVTIRKFLTIQTFFKILLLLFLAHKITCCLFELKERLFIVHLDLKVKTAFKLKELKIFFSLHLRSWQVSLIFFSKRLINPCRSL